MYDINRYYIYMYLYFFEGSVCDIVFLFLKFFIFDDEMMLFII